MAMVGIRPEGRGERGGVASGDVTGEAFVTGSRLLSGSDPVLLSAEGEKRGAVLCDGLVGGVAVGLRKADASASCSIVCSDPLLCLACPYGGLVGEIVVERGEPACAGAEETTALALRDLLLAFCERLPPTARAAESSLSSKPGTT